MWPDRRFLDLVGIEHPIVQAPMAGSNKSALAIAVSQAGGLGSLPCGMLSLDQARRELQTIQQSVDGPFNANFLCHESPVPDPARDAAWRARLAPYYAELGLDPEAAAGGASRTPFDDARCALVEEIKPRVASFHFGLPEARLVERVKAAGCLVLSSATTVTEARWLEAQGADVIIAQGVEAGGHRGHFLEDDLSRQTGIFTLLPHIVDAVALPVIAAGGIADARGIAAALMLGASAVQIGTAYMLTPEASTTAIHRAALRRGAGEATALTNVFSGRPARGLINRAMRELGPLSAAAPAFPLASAALAPLRGKAEADGSGDFSPLWAGQGVELAKEMAAGALTAALAAETQDLLRRMAGGA